MRRNEPEAKVEITNIKKIVPACRRCRIRTNDLMTDLFQPVLCPKCADVIRTEFSHMVPLDLPNFEKARLCLWEHERECNCWHDGCRFPDAHQ